MKFARLEAPSARSSRVCRPPALRARTAHALALGQRRRSIATPGSDDRRERQQVEYGELGMRVQAVGERDLFWVAARRHRDDAEAANATRDRIGDRRRDVRDTAPPGNCDRDLVGDRGERVGDVPRAPNLRGETGSLAIAADGLTVGYRIWDLSWPMSEEERRAAAPRSPTRIKHMRGGDGEWQKFIIDPNPPFVPGGVRREYRLFAPYSGTGCWSAKLGAIWEPTGPGEPVWAVCDRCGARGLCGEHRHYSGIYAYATLGLLLSRYPSAGCWRHRPGDGDRAKIIGRIRLLGRVLPHSQQELRAEGCVIEQLIVPNVFEHAETLANVVDELGVYGVPIYVREPAEVSPRHTFEWNASREMHERLRRETVAA